MSPKGGRRTRRRDAGAAKITGVKRQDAPKPAPETAKERLRHYLPYIAVPNAALVLGVVALCLAVILIGGLRAAYLPASIGQTWFALHAAPMSVDGVTLTAMPLLPAIGVAALVASRVRAATAGRVSILDLCTLLGFNIAIPLTLSAIALFMVHDASAVFAIQTPPVGAALCYPVLVHLLGFVLGIRAVLWRALARRAGIPQDAVEAGADAGHVVFRLWLAAGVVFLVALAFGYERIAQLVGEFPNLGWAGALALIGLCILYLPNAATATLGVLLGGSFQYGGASVSLFDTAAVPYPPLPLFAAIPPSVAQWAPVLMVIPAAVALHFFASRPLTYVGVVATATWTALLGALIGVFSAGVAGAYGLVGVDPWWLASLLFIWVLVAGLVLRTIASLRQSAPSGDA